MTSASRKRWGDPRHRFTSPEELQTLLEGYESRKVPNDVWRDVLRPFVVPAVLEFGPKTIWEAYQALRYLTGLTAWCLERGIPLDRERVLDPDVVERFVFERQNWRDQNTCRFYLRKLGYALTRQAPWEPPHRRVHSEGLAPPYSVSDLARLRRAARAQTPLRRHRAVGLIALGAGASVVGRWASTVSGGDVAPLGEGLGVRVGLPNERVVPVLAAFEHDLAWVADESGGGLLLDGLKPGEVTRQFEAPLGVPRLDPNRLRSTWLATHLALGTRLPELLEAAGIRTATQLHSLFPYIEMLPDAEAAAMLRGEA